MNWCLWLLQCAAACAAIVQWEPRPANEGVVLYRVWGGTNSRVYETNWTVVSTQFSVPPGWTHVTVTAQDSNNLESLWGAELVLGPGAPVALSATYETNLTVTLRAGFIVSATTTNWTPVATVVVTNATAPRTFFIAQPSWPKAKAAPAPPRP